MHYVKEPSIHFKIKSGFNKCYLYKTRKGYLLATLFQNNTQMENLFLSISNLHLRNLHPRRIYRDQELH